MTVAQPIQALLGQALDVAALRQAVHTSNIANASVDGFRRLDVSFDAELARASLSLDGSSAATNEAFSQAHVIQTSESVRLDKEMALMAQDAVQYQTLLNAVNKSFSLLRLAVREGREG